MDKQYVIGIDVGTSGCKSIIVDEKGEVISSSLKEYPLYTPHPGWAEQRPQDWWNATVDSLKYVLDKSKIDPRSIKGIGLSAQMHGLVALDKDLQVIRPAILWNDQRTMKQCLEIFEIVGSQKKLIDFTNNTMLPGYTGGKILWLREEEPQNYERALVFLNPKDYIRLKLTGDLATEVSDASGTGLFDVKRRRWSGALLRLLDIDEEKLPKCYESIEITGHLSESVSEMFALPKNIPVVGGGGDSVIQTTGTGLIKQGILGTTLGTAGIIAMGLDGFRYNKSGNLQIFCNNSPDKWHIMGVTLSAGGSLQWYKNNLCKHEVEISKRIGKNVYALLDEEAASSEVGAKNLLYLPYLIGERCPYPDPNAKGTFIGLTLRHNQNDMTRAVLEGVIFSFRQVYDLIIDMDKELTVSEIRTSGGGSSSALWKQIHSDIFQLPVKTVSGSSEGGAYGAALVAGSSCGIWENLEKAMDILKIESETLPEEKNKEKYDELYSIYGSLYSTLKTTFDKLSVIS